MYLDKDTTTKRLFWYTISETSRSSRNGIPEKYKKEFSEKSITCGQHFVHVIRPWTHLYSVEYHDIDPAQEREIFQRVQLGMTLTAAGSFQLSIKNRSHLTALAEKLQAISSPYAE